MGTPNITIAKKNALKNPFNKHASGGLANFILVDNEDDTFEIQGTDTQGNRVDISSVATAVVSSDNESVLAVDAPTGMTSAMHTVGSPPALGSANITAVVTWNDGSLGPFTVTLPVSVVTGPVGGVVITPGVPTIKA